MSEQKQRGEVGPVRAGLGRVLPPAKGQDRFRELRGATRPWDQEEACGGEQSCFSGDGGRGAP